MNTYSLILAIFTFAMVSIVGTHRNKTENSAHELVNVIKIDLSRINTSRYIESRFISDQFNDYSASKAEITRNEFYVDKNLVKIKAKNEAKSLSQKLAYSKQSTRQDQKTVSTSGTRNTSDLEDENNAPELTFNFEQPAELAPAVYARTNITPTATNKPTKKDKQINAILAKVDYWDTVHSIESKQGKLLYRPRNKSRSCNYTTAPCGHHQLTVRALKDIGCKSLQCRKDRLNYSKSLKMSKKLLAKNEKRLKKNGYENLEDYQKYLIHQQGASGIKVILAATKGEKLLSRRIKKNMANNSPYSYRKLTRMGSRLAARMFMNHWKKNGKKRSC